MLTPSSAPTPQLSPEVNSLLQAYSIKPDRVVAFDIPDSVELLEPRIANMSQQGFDVAQISNKFGAILSFNEDAFDSRIKMFDSLGLDPKKIVGTNPAVLSHAPKTVADRFAHLAKLGLDAHRVVSNFSPVLQLNSDGIDRRLNYLSGLGLDSISVANSSPMILKLSLDPSSPTSLPSKVQAIDALGMDSAVVLSKYPKILTNGSDRVKESFSAIQEVTHGTPATAAAVAELNPKLLGDKPDDLRTTARVLHGNHTPLKTTADIRSALSNHYPEEAVLKVLGHKISRATRAESKLKVAELLIDPAARAQLGAFATLSYMNLLSTDQKQAVTESIDLHQDIKTFHIEQI